jgi:hypothetical protein
MYELQVKLLKDYISDLKRKDLKDEVLAMNLVLKDVIAMKRLGDAINNPKKFIAEGLI